MRKFVLLAIAWLSFSVSLQAQDKQVGAFILVSQEGEVTYLGAQGAPAEAVSVGKPIPLSHTIITGKNGKLVGLLSNGTLLTLEEDTRMKVGTFKQEPFVAGGKKLTDLPGEPSSSEVMLDLDFGSLVVKTKKLNKGSVFDINSPVGVAGIRGTEFQMASRPGQGVQLDVTESIVAFTPPGGVPMPVSQGNGLSVSPTGVPKMRPVNPTVARKIETTNQTATEATQEVSLGEVVVAMEQSAKDVEAEAMEDAPAQESAPEEEPMEEPAPEEADTEVESEDPQPTEEAPAEETAPAEEPAPLEELPADKPEDVEPDEPAPLQEPAGLKEPEPLDEFPPLPEESDLLEELNSLEDRKKRQEKREEEEGNRLGQRIFEEEENDAPLGQRKRMEEEESLGLRTTQEEGESEDRPFAQQAGTIKKQDDAQDSGDPGAQPNSPKSATPQKAPEKTSASQPSKPEQPAKLNQPAKPATPQAPPSVAGKLPDVTRIVQESDPKIIQERELKKHQLSDSQKAQFDVLSPTTKAQVKELQTPVIQRLTTIEAVGEEETVAFLNLSEEARELVLGLEDSVMTTLLQQNIDEELLVESLTKMNMSFPTPSDVPNFQPDFPGDAPLQELSTKLRENGNSWVMDELFELSGGDLTEEWIEKGEIALLLLEDYRLDEITPAQALAAQKALSNPFYLEISALFEELALDELVSGEGTLIGGHNLIITENAQAMQPYFWDGVEEVILSATEDIRIEASFEWEAPLETSNARLVLMSGNNLQVTEGVSLRSATSDLVIASRNQLSLKDVKLYGAREVSLRGMRDVSLDNVEIGASTLAKIKARRDLDVNGLSFRQDISKIVMEATTLRLRNVDFPGSAQVRLNSSLGGVDGRYPNFGDVSAAQQIGRVNFIENVKSGGNLLNNRAAFDQHGGNIQIGRITNP
jgi:hypothetical protein